MTYTSAQALCLGGHPANCCPLGSFNVIFDFSIPLFVCLLYVCVHERGRCMYVHVCFACVDTHVCVSAYMWRLDIDARHTSQYLFHLIC